MLEWLKNLTGRKAATPAPPTSLREMQMIRRWEAAQTDRLNSAHWKNVGEVNLNTINADLAFDLPTLRSRCIYEAQNNPFVEGVIETHSTDVVGAGGPKLQVQSDSDKYNRGLEQIWADWFSMPDINGVLSGPEMLRLWVRQLWTCGEYLSQIVTDPAASGPVAMRLLDLHPARLISPPWTAADPFTVLGIRRTREGKPLEYFISDPLPFGAFTLSYGNFTSFDPRYILHEFKVVEPGQARGIPWLAPALPTISDLRDFDTQVLDAARAAADWSVYLYSDHPDAPFFNANESTQIERRTVSTLPPGWRPSEVKSEHPAQNYLDFRKERQREIGRPVGMPLMTVRLGSEDHNYSSARYDGKVYWRSLDVVQSGIGSKALTRLAKLVAQEAELAGALPKRPANARFDWTWQPPVKGDPEKEYEAYLAALEIGAMDLSDVAAEQGTDLETLIAKRKRTAEMLTVAGLPPAPFWQPQPAMPIAEKQPPDKVTKPTQAASQ